MLSLSRIFLGAAALFAMAVRPGYSQLLSVGVKAGVPLTSAYSAAFDGQATGTAYDRLYVIGPTVELHLPFHLSVEADALYRRSGFAFTGLASATRASVNDWQIPILAKYELHFGPIRPFADGGVVARHVTASSAVGPDNPNSVGVALGAGVTLKLLHFRLSPEIRYTHWPSPPYSSAPFNGYVLSTSNQADFLVGFTF